jgi:propionate CoA-transferase
VARAGTLDPKRVRIPSVLVDALVVDPTQQLSRRTLAHPGLIGALRTISEPESLQPGVRRVIARRAAGELRRGDIVNLGYGIADGVAKTAAEEGFATDVTFTIEQGHIGGVPMSGTDFGLALNPQASIDATSQFDWYDGGGLDIGFLSFAQIDESGRVNVSRFAGRTPGIGGYLNIAQGARRLVLLGTLTAGGGTPKFVTSVDHVSFDAAAAAAGGKHITVITERVVFRLHADGLELVEIAPELDVEADVFGLMSFRPRVSDDMRPMPDYAFAEQRTGMQLDTAPNEASQVA